MDCQLDHLVIAARTLGEGIGQVSRRLGVEPVAGGRHAFMGTHNALLSLGPLCFLEVIAVDPDAPAPDCPRWFGLDDFQGPPRLVHWVARTGKIDRFCPADHRVVAMARGEFRWRFALALDGRLPLNGAVPALIQWQDGSHPCNRLPDHGLRLRRLSVAHADPHRLRTELARLGLAETVAIAGNGPVLTADIQRDGALVTLR